MTAEAQRYIPKSADWTVPTLPPPGVHPLGIYTADPFSADGQLDGGLTSDGGYFLRRVVGEGDDLRVCLSSHSTIGVAGAMVRDSDKADSAFVFAGKDETGSTIVIYRQRAGEPAVAYDFDPPASYPWYRLVVGGGTVYVYGALASHAGVPGTWVAIAAVKIELSGGNFSTPKPDLAGFFVSNGSAGFSDLFLTEHLIWTERTATTADQEPPLADWPGDAPDLDKFAESATLLRREGGGSESWVDFPITAPRAGTYRLYVHHVAGGSPDGNWYYPVWQKTAGTTTPSRIDVDNTATGNMVKRTQYGFTNPPTWNAVAHSTNVLVGDGVFRARFSGAKPRAHVGLTGAPAGNDPATITYRFYNFTTGNGTVIAYGPGFSASHAFDEGDWIEIERLGSHFVFRRLDYVGGALIPYHLGISPVPVVESLPLHLDTTFFDENARVLGSRVTGLWTSTANAADLDGDGLGGDWLERWVVDADPEDGIQSILDVNSADADGDGRTNQQEYDYTDSYAAKTDPTKADSDGDGLTDPQEIALGTFPRNSDSDGDRLLDGIEVNSGLNFNPLDPDSDSATNNSVGDYTEWEIITFLAGDAFATQADVTEDPEQDFDGDRVSNLHESEDRTSAVQSEDYFSPVVFERLFGSHVGVDHVINTSASGILSTRLDRTAAAGVPAGGISHHEGIDETRLRFEFKAASANDRIRIGFARRNSGAVAPAKSRVEIEFPAIANAPVQVLFDGISAGVAPFYVSPGELLELRLDFVSDPPAPPRLHIEKLVTGNQVPLVEPVSLPAGLTDPDTGVNPLTVVVDLVGSDAEIFNARYRRVHDPDRDDDLMWDAWEDRYGLSPLIPADASGDLEPDGLLNLEEYQRGTDPTVPDSDGDGMTDGWEHDYGLDPKSNADGTPTADKDGDGLSNRVEFDFGTRPDTKFTAGDAFSDQWRHLYGLHPTDLLDPGSDDDEDGLSLAQEYAAGTDPDEDDTDGDGMDDKFEVDLGLDPTDPGGDYDGDGILNVDEIVLGTDPTLRDTDEDRLDDGDETTFGTDPLESDSDGDGLPDGWEVEGLVMHYRLDFVAEAPAPGEKVYSGEWSYVIYSESRDPVTDEVIGREEDWSRPYILYDQFGVQNDEGTETIRRSNYRNEEGIFVYYDGSVLNPAGDLVPANHRSVLQPNWNAFYNTTLRLWVGTHTTAGHTGTWWWVVTDPLEPDTDGDELPDGWEYEHWLHPDLASDATGNPEADGLANLAEFGEGTHPWRADTDGDSLSDGHEVNVSLSDPLDPEDPGVAGGGVPPLTAPLPVMTRTTLFTSPDPGDGATPAPTLPAHGSAAPSSPGAAPGAPGTAHPGSSAANAEPGATPKDEPQPTPEDELFLEVRILEKSVGGGPILVGAEPYEPNGDHDNDEVLNFEDVDYMPFPGTLEMHPYFPKLEYERDGAPLASNLAATHSSEEIGPAINYLNDADIAVETDWDNHNPIPATGASIVAVANSAAATEKEVRLVRRANGEPGAAYLPVEMPVKRTFLKVTRSRTSETEQLPAGPWEIGSVEKVELVIEKTKTKAVEDVKAPVAKAVLEPGIAEGWETEVSFSDMEFVQGELGTEDEDPGNWLMTEADPRPEVEMLVTDAQLLGGRLTISVQGTVKDSLSKYAVNGSERVTNLHFVVDGEVVHSISLGNNVAYGEDFNETVTLPNVLPRGYTLRAETTENAAGNTGWDQIAVGITMQTSQSVVAGGNLTLSFSNQPSSVIVDSFSVSSIDGSGTLTETAVDSNEYTGIINGVNVGAFIGFDENFSDTQVDQVLAKVTVGGIAFHGTWEETGVSTLAFGPIGYQGGGDALTVGASVDLPGSQNEEFKPITFRVQGPADWAETDDVKLKIGTTQYQLKEFSIGGSTALYPFDAQFPDEPKQFLPSEKTVPQKLRIPLYSPGGGELPVKLVAGGSERYITSVQVERGVRVLADTSIASGGHSAGAPGFWRPGEAVTENQLRDAYELVYGGSDEAMLLLELFDEDDNIITLKNVWGQLDVNPLRADQKIEIEIEHEGAGINPITCANFLYAGLHIAMAHPPLNERVGDVGSIEQFVQARSNWARYAAEVTATGAEMYVSGIGIALEPVDWVLVINDASEGHVSSLAAALPFVPVSVVKGARRMVFNTLDGEFLGEITDEAQLIAIQVASRKRAFKDKIAILEEAGLDDGVITLLVRGGEIQYAKAHNTLKDRMRQARRPKPRGDFEAQHDLPWEFRREFAESKIDVNDEMFGRWVHRDDHTRWHNEEPKFNDVWEEFFYEDPGIQQRRIYRTKDEIMQKLKEVRTAYTRTITE